MPGFEIEGWHWIMLGAVLMVAEMLVPGTMLVWFGAAAVLTGLAVSVVDLDFAFQILIFGVLSLVTIFPARAMVRRLMPGDAPGADKVNNFGADMIGRRATISEPVVNGTGAVHFGDTRWKVRCDTDMAAGGLVEITGTDGAVLRVRPVGETAAA